MLSAVIGVAPGIVAAAGGDPALLPFSGALSAVIGCACAVNLYGAQLKSLWVTMTVPRAAGNDVRGRQLAWLLVIGPYSCALSLVLTFLSGHTPELVWVLALVPALVGAGPGIVVLGSLVWVLGPDPDGGPTPAWSLETHAALILTAAPAIPPAALLTVGTAAHLPGLRWMAVPVGIAIGLGGYLSIGRLAISRLKDAETRLLSRT